MSLDPRRIYVSEGHERAIASITVWPPDNLDRSSRLLADIRAQAMQRMVPGMSCSVGPATVPDGMRAPIAGFTFTAEHVPLPFEDILEWLRGQAWVRVIEVERSN